MKEAAINGGHDTIGSKAAATASAVLFGRIFSIFMAGIAFILIARILGPANYGIYAVAVAVAGFFMPASDFGIGTTFSKFIGEYSVKHETKKIAELLANGYVIVLVIGAVSTLVVLGLSGLFASYVLHNVAYAYVLQVAAFMIIMCVLNGASYSAMVGFGLGKQLSIGAALQITVQAVSSVALALMGLGALAPVIGLILGYASGAAFALWVVLGRANVSGARVSTKAMRRVLSFSAPLAASNVVSSITSNITIVVLGVFVAASIVGNFGVVQRTSTLVGVISDSIGIAIVPMFAAHLAQKRSEQKSGAFYNYAVYVAFIFIAPIMLYVTLLSVPFTITVFTGVYSGASLYIAIMSVGVLIGIAGTYAMNLLTSANKVMTVAKCTAVITAVQLASLAVLVPYFHGLGAVLQLFVVTPLVTSMVFLYAMRKELDVRLNLARVSRVVLASLVSAAFILPLITLIHGYIALLIAAAIEQVALYPPVLALTGAVLRRDLDTFRRLSLRIPLVGSIIRVLASYSEAFCRFSIAGT